MRLVLVRDLMSRPAVCTTPDCSVLDASRTMRARNIGALVVNDGPRSVGIITERDIVGKVVAEGLDAAKVTVGELMSSPLLTVEAGADVLDAAVAMARHGVRRLPVLNGDGGAAGILCERDILAVSPDLVALTRMEGAEAEAEPLDEEYISKCEACMCLTDGLRGSDGMLLCEDCWQEQRMRV